MPDRQVGDLMEQISKLHEALESVQQQRDAAIEESQRKLMSEEEKKSEIGSLRKGIVKMLRLSGIALNVNKLNREVPDWHRQARYLGETLIHRPNWLNMEKYLTSDKPIDRFIGNVMWENTKAKLAPAAPAP